jgi:fructosamine-3-kinase
MDSEVHLAHSLAATFGGSWSVQRLQASGFCATWRARGGGQALFVKSLPLAQREVLDAEADSLLALAAVDAIRVPALIRCWGDREAGEAVLAMEWLDLCRPDEGFGTRFGRALGDLHDARPHEGGGRFGWRRDNLIGPTPQRNRWSKDATTAGWIDFFRGERLQPMRDRLGAHGQFEALAEAVDAVMAMLPEFFADGHAPRASLIHGDLWSGNWGMLSDGTPVIYDPAVSCSDAEAELAMMELFGQPPSGFWNAYTDVLALREGYARRRGLYQLYHLLNHALLFGGGYVLQATDLARYLVRNP